MTITSLEREAATCERCRRSFKSGRAAGSTTKRKRATVCSTCRSRERRQRHKTAAREDPQQNIPAYVSDALGLTEADKAGVEHLARTEIKDEHGRAIGHLGVTSLDELLRCVDRSGRVDGIIETAWALPLWQYRKVEEAIAKSESRAREAKRSRATAHA
jgi:hypothetical protein